MDKHHNTHTPNENEAEATKQEEAKKTSTEDIEITVEQDDHGRDVATVPDPKKKPSL